MLRISPKLAEIKETLPGLYAKLEQCGLLYQDEMPASDYSFHATGLGAPNTTRFIQGRPYWPMKSSIQCKCLKNIILNYRELLNPLRKSELFVLEFFFHIGFSLFLRHENGSLDQLHWNTLDVQMQGGTITSSKKIISELHARGEDDKQFFILDNSALYQICQLFHHSFAEPSFIYEQDYESYTVSPNSAYKMQQIFENLENKTIKKLYFLCGTDDEDGSKMACYDMTREKIRLFVNSITRGNPYSLTNEFILNKKSSFEANQILSHPIESLEINTAEPIPTFKEVKKVIVSVKHAKLKLTPSIKELRLNGTVEKLDLSKLPLLETLFIGDQVTSIIGLEQCRLLKKIEIRSLLDKKHLPINWAQFPELETLYLRGLNIFNLHQCKKLTQLSLFDQEFKAPLDLSQWPNLEFLELLNVDKVKIEGEFKPIAETKDSKPQTRTLKLDHDVLLTTAKSVLKHVTHLEISFTAQCSEITVNSLDFPFLTYLSISKMEKASPEITIKLESLSNLQTLSIHNFAEREYEDKSLGKTKHFLTKLSGIEDCLNLENLAIQGHVIDLDVSRLQKLNLIYLDIPALSDQPELKGDENLPQLGAYIRNSPPRTFETPPTNIKIRSQIETLRNRVKRIYEVLYKLNLKTQLPKKLKPEAKLLDDDSSTIHLKNCNRMSFDAKFKKNKQIVRVQNIFQNEQNPTYNRRDIFNQVEMIENKLFFYSVKGKNTRKIDLKTSQIKNAGQCATLQLNLKPQETYYLTGKSTKDEIINWSKNTGLTLYEDIDLQQFFIRNETTNEFNGIVSYELITDEKNYLKENLQADPIIEKADLLPRLIKEQITKLFNKIKEEKVSVDFQKIIHAFEEKEIDAKAKLNLLINYLKQFTDEDNDEENSLTSLFNLFKNANGYCRHRTFIMMIICLYLNIPARISANGIHAIIEIFTQDGCEGICLGGGGDRQYQFIEAPIMTPADPFKNVIDQTETKAEKKQETIMAEEKDITYSPSIFYSQGQYLEDCLTPLQLIQEVMKQNGNPLIRTKDAKDARRIDQLLKQTCFEEKISHLYIDQPAELESLFRSTTIVDKSLSEETGELAEFIDNRGLLIINWNTFSRKKRNTYKSLLDDPPTLHGIKLNAQIKVVGILSQTINPGDIFLSRTYEFDWPKAISLPHKEFPDQPWIVQNSPLPEKLIATVIDLYQDSNWYVRLVESAVVTKQGFSHKKGPLLKAMIEGKSLIIKNAPWENEEFNRFWFHLTNEQEVRTLTGAVKKNKDLKLYLLDNSERKSSSHISLKEEIPELKSSKNTHYINRANFNLFFERQHVNKQNKILYKAIIDFKPGDSIIIEDNLSQHEINHLLDALEDFNKKQTEPSLIQVIIDPRFLKPWHAATLPHCKEIKELNTCFIASNDPDFATQQLCEKFKVKTQNVFYIDSMDGWPELIEDIQLQREEKSISAKHSYASFCKKLSKGETVILQGNLESSRLNLLQTLFNQPSHLIINGIKRVIKSKIIWIHPPQEQYSYSHSPRFAADFQLDDYVRSLQAELKTNEVILKKVSQFVQHLIKEKITINYFKFKKIYQLALEADSLNSDNNPVKAITSEHFRHQGELFAYLNVLGKIYFASSKAGYLRNDKLIALKASISADADQHQIIWRMANCLSPEILRYVFNNYLPTLTFTLQPTVVTKLIETINLLQNKPDYFYFSEKSGLHAKQKRKITQSLTNKKRLILLMGDTGTGKTHTAKNIVKEMELPYFYGEKFILDWLEKGGILILDEINLIATGHWEWLKGLFLKKPKIDYKGKSYPLTDAHQVIATGNYLNYCKRYFHLVFYDYAEIITFKPFKDYHLKGFIDLTWDEFKLPTSSDKTNCIQLLLQTYRLLEKSAHYPLDVSLRDLKNVLIRIKIILERTKNKSLEDLTRHAIWLEFNGALDTGEARQQFKDFLRTESMAAELKLPTKSIIPDEMQEIWQSTNDNLLIRLLRCQTNDNSLSKLCELIEGASGVGKSTLFVSMLEMLGFSTEAKDPQMRYYQITVGSLGVEALLVKAFHEGSIVILDELNLDPALEQLLNQLLSGTDMNGKLADKAGFMVFASQNPGAGCISKALLNRTHKLTISDFSQEALIEIARKFLILNPVNFVEAFNEARKTYPKINYRGFFQKASEVADKQNLPSITPPLKLSS